jgi:ABC-type branched-subunit amino acid transport system substrate-binding protein
MVVLQNGVDDSLGVVSECALLVEEVLVLSSQPTMRIGIMLDMNSTSGRAIAGAASLAIASLKNSSVLPPNVAVEWQLEEAGCDLSEAAAVSKQSLNALRAIMDRWGKVDLIVGPVCSQGCMVSAAISSALEVPHVSHGCAAVDSDGAFPFFFRTAPSDAAVLEVVVALLRSQQWTKVALMRDDGGLQAAVVQGSVAKAGLAVGLVKVLVAGVSAAAQLKDVARANLRIVLVCAAADSTSVVEIGRAAVAGA